MKVKKEVNIISPNFFSVRGSLTLNQGNFLITSSPILVVYKYVFLLDSPLHK